MWWLCVPITAVALGQPASDANRPVSVPIAANVETESAHRADLDDASPSKTAPATQSTGGMKISPRTRPARYIDRDSNTNTANGGLASSNNRVGWWVTTAIGLAIVLLVIQASRKALVRVVPGLAPVDTTGPIHLLFRRPLTPKHAVCLVRCGDRLLLIGLAGDRMQTLAEITDSAEIDQIKGQCLQVRPFSATQAFRELWTRAERDLPPPDELNAGEEPQRVRSAESPLTSAGSDLARQIGSLRDRLLSWKGREAG